MKSAVALALLAAQFAVSVDGHEPAIVCPNGYFEADDRICVRFERLDVSASSATERCHHLGGIVYEPMSGDEFAAVTHALDLHDEDPFLIGIDDRESEDTIIYSSSFGTGSPELITWSNFNATSLNDPDRDCVEVDPATGEWFWTYCSGDYDFVCQANPLVIDCFEQNVRFEENFGLTYVSKEQCRDLCRSSEACKYYVYDGMRCKIYDLRFNNIISDSAFYTWGTSLTDGFTGSRPVGFATHATDALACQKSCQKDHRCESFEFHTDQGEYHQLLCVHNYHKTTRRMVMLPFSTTTYISGPKNCGRRRLGNGICHVRITEEDY